MVSYLVVSYERVTVRPRSELHLGQEASYIKAVQEASYSKTNVASWSHCYSTHVL